MRAFALVMIGWLAVGCGSAEIDADASILIDAAAAPIDASFEPWREPDYAARIAFTIDNQRREPLEDFPLAIRFVGNRNRMGDDGELIVFHNGSERIVHEVERIGVESLVWVRTDLSGTSRIWMYFDSSTPNQMSSGADTFDGFESVYHFYDEFNSTAIEQLDDALGNNNMTVSGLDSATHGVEGIGTAIAYPMGSQFYAQSTGARPGLTVDDGQSLSFEAWFRVPTGEDDRTVISNFSSDCEGMHVFIGDGTPDVGDGSTDVGVGILHAGFFTANQCDDTTNDRALLVVPNRLDDNRWHHIAFTVNRSTAMVELFVDGVSSGVTTGGDMTGRTTNFPLRLGNNSRNQIEAIDGILDEVRVGSIRSADWYQATFLNGHPKTDVSNPSDFVTAAGIEERP